MTRAAARPTILHRKMRGPRTQMVRARWLWGIAFSLPLIALIGVFLVLPIVQTFYYSFTTWDGITSTPVGMGNYQQLFRDTTFWQVVSNNAILLASIPLAILIPLVIAFLLNERVFGWSFFRSVYFLPTAISWVVIGMVAIRFFASQGILNGFLQTIGLRVVHTDLLSSDSTAIIAVIITFIWSVFGTNTIIFITGMATLDREMYEAARVDGAGPWQILFLITIPMLMRFIQFAFILTVITAFTALFSLIFIMTQGGPGFATTTLEFFIFEKGFNNGVFGLASAIGVVLFIVVFVIWLAQYRILRSRTD